MIVRVSICMSRKPHQNTAYVELLGDRLLYSDDTFHRCREVVPEYHLHTLRCLTLKPRAAKVT
jgi:hypothetical protein